MSRVLSSEVADRIRASREELQSHWDDPSLKLGASSQRRAATQSKLLQAARALITARGLGYISVGDIANTAGFTRGAFYSNFADMEALVRRLAHDTFAEVLWQAEKQVRSVQFPTADGLPLTERIALLAAAMQQVTNLDKETYIFYTEISLYVGRHPETSVALQRILTTVHTIWQEMLTSLLRAFDLTASGQLADLVQVIMALVERSTNQALVLGEADVAALLRRNLTPVLGGLVRDAAGE